LNGFLWKVAAGGGVTLVSLLVAKVMTLVSTIVIARLLIPSEFGEYSVVVNLQNFAVTLASFGVPLALAKHISQWRNVDKQLAEEMGSALFTVLLLASVITAAGLLLLSSPIASDLYRDRGLTPVIRLSAVFVVVATMNLGLSSVLQGCQRIASLAEINAIAAVFVPLIAFLMVSQFGLEGAILTLVASNLISGALFVIVIRRTFTISWGAARRLFQQRAHIRALLSFTIPTLLATLMVVPAYWIAKTTLALEAGFAAAGNFQIADSLSQMPMIIPVAMGVSLLPVVSELNSAHPEQVGKSAQKLLNIVVFAVIPASVLSLPFLKFAIEFLYGFDYREAHVSTIMMFAATTLISTGSVISNVIMGTGRMWHALLLNAIWLATFLALLFALIPMYGAEGLAGAYALSYAAFFVILSVYFSHGFHAKIGGVLLTSLLYLAFVFLYAEFLADDLFSTRLLVGVVVSALFAILGYVFILGPPERSSLWRAVERGRFWIKGGPD